MKKNLVLMLSLVAIVLLFGCGKKTVENQNGENLNSGSTEIENTEVENFEDENTESDMIGEEAVEVEYHPEWLATSLTSEDLDNIEGTQVPVSYNYEIYDINAESVTDSGAVTNNGGRFHIPEYDNMVDREIITSSMDGNRIYTLANLTLVDGSIVPTLYVYDPETLHCISISAQHEDSIVMYSNFDYSAANTVEEDAGEYIEDGNIEEYVEDNYVEE